MDAEVGEVDLSLNLVGKVETGKSNEFLINAPLIGINALL